MVRRKNKPRKKRAPSAATAVGLGMAIDGIIDGDVPYIHTGRQLTENLINAYVPTLASKIGPKGVDIVSGALAGFTTHKAGAYARRKGFRLRFAGINWP